MKFLPITLATLTDLRVESSALLKDVCQANLAIFNNQPSTPWCAYFLEQNHQLVGTCAFKSVPVNGRVEIAYFTFPDYEGQGIATRMADHLVNLAKAEDPSVIVFAQTLAKHSASTRILRRRGFVHTKTFVDPEDGELWEWELV
jgi:[ribosomal protein S5]-alanine N-acetyltransferase